MVIDHFVQNSWADYVEQVKVMNDNEKAEIAADFQACGMSDAMTLSQMEGGFSVEDAKTIFNAILSELSVEQKKAFV